MFRRHKNRACSLREEVLALTQAELKVSSQDETLPSLQRSPSLEGFSYLANTPSSASLRGSLLRNKLENPLFNFRLFSKTRKTLSRQNSVSYNETDRRVEKEVQEDDKVKKRQSYSLLKIASFRSSAPRKNTFSSRLNNFRLFPARTNTRKSNLKIELNRTGEPIAKRLSDSSSSSSGSSLSLSEDSDDEKESLSEEEDDLDIDILTRFEEEQANNEMQSFVMSTHKGQPVKVEFFFDYLLISPMNTLKKNKKSKRRSKEEVKAKARIVYYEDLASWTNNSECLRLIHVRDKNTVKQSTTEIKLFVYSSKNSTTTPERLNMILKDKVSVLLASKLGCEIDSALRIIENGEVVGENEGLSLV